MGKECPYQYGLQDMILTVFADLSLVPDTEAINNISLRLVAPSQSSALHNILLKNQCSLKS